MSKLSMTTIAARYGFGVLLLIYIILAGLTTGHSPILYDLDGSGGLFLALAVGLLTPPRWLWLTFLVIAAYLTWMTGFCFYLSVIDRSKNGVLLPVAFLFASMLLVACSVVSKRNVAKLQA